jgi:hypothetical protein
MHALIRQRELDSSFQDITNPETCLRRLDCGLLHYEQCSADELKKFCIDRGVIKRSRLIDTSVPVTQSLLASILVSADDNIEFTRLLKLPPELRLIIYEHYVAYFADEALLMPTLPPLARVSKELYKEVRPVFFQKCMFEMVLMSPVGNRSLFHLNTPTLALFEGLDPAFLAMI